jgi:hypothetical protein
MLEHPKSLNDYQGETVKDETMENQQITDLVWFVGIFEGEGSVGLKGHIRGNNKKHFNVSPHITITNSDMLILNKIRSILNSIGINPYITTKTKSKNPCFDLCITKISHIKKLIDIVEPFIVGNKMERLLLIKDFVNSRIHKTKDDEYTEQEQDVILKFYSDYSKSGISETAREIFRKMNERKIQSELMGNHKRMAEMTIPSIAFQCIR